MSWSVSVSGTPAEVREQLARQVEALLAAPPAGLAGDAERATVKKVNELAGEVLDALDPERTLTIVASGFSTYGDPETKRGAFQSIDITVRPGPLAKHAENQQRFTTED